MWLLVGALSLVYNLEAHIDSSEYSLKKDPRQHPSGPKSYCWRSYRFRGHCPNHAWLLEMSSPLVLERTLPCTLKPPPSDAHGLPFLSHKVDTRHFLLFFLVLLSASPMLLVYASLCSNVHPSASIPKGYGTLIQVIKINGNYCFSQEIPVSHSSTPLALWGEHHPLSYAFSYHPSSFLPWLPVLHLWTWPP